MSCNMLFCDCVIMPLEFKNASIGNCHCVAVVVGLIPAKATTCFILTLSCLYDGCLIIFINSIIIIRGCNLVIIGSTITFLGLYCYWGLSGGHTVFRRSTITSRCGFLSGQFG